MADRHGGWLKCEAGARGSTGVILAVWAAAVLKLVAAVLPLLARRRLSSPAWNRNLWVLAWVEAAILTIYGVVLTAPGLLLQTGVIHASANADHCAVAWRAYLWDPWFLI